jgi:pimeloyl-ACP methyl ester carboxylesterase
MINKSARAMYFDESKITTGIYEKYKDFTLREGNRKALVNRLNKLRNDRSSQIKNIQTPTLIIWGEDDTLIPLEFAYKFEKDLPNSELVIIKEAGHLPMEESPEKVIGIVEDFLSE